MAALQSLSNNFTTVPWGLTIWISKSENLSWVAFTITFTSETIPVEDGTVTVLGTQFNVKSREGFFEVHCYEGLVSLSFKNNEAINIPAGSRFRIVNGERYFEQTPESAPGWIKNMSTLKSVPYIQVVKEFERQYNVSIKLIDVNQNQLFTGGFVHNSLQDGLKSITLPLDLTYSVDNDKNIIIISK